MEKEVKKKAKEKRKKEIRGIQEIDTKCLDVFAYDYPGRETELEIVTDEFTSLCPWSGLPDFGRLTIRYVPAQHCIELKSLKFYLLSYRSVGIAYENAVNRILDDLVACCQPLRMKVTGDFTTRGGIKTRVEASYQKK
ncbi:NADPH-dependent 7-cyano-7-deazaguanine reductase [subsurface metagenome]